MKRLGDPLLRPSSSGGRTANASGDDVPDDIASMDATVAVDVEGLYRDHRLRLAHLAAAITLDRALAEEIVQDAFEGLQRRRTSVDNPIGYLQTSVIHRSVSVLRRRRVAVRHPVPVASVSVSPEIDETWGKVTRLPPRERAVVVLRYWQDLSEADIATTLGWPSGTVKSTLHRSLQRLRKDIER